MLSNKIINSFRKFLISDYVHINNSIRNITLSAKTCREVDDRKEMYRSLPALDEGTAGEKTSDIDALIHE